MPDYLALPDEVVAETILWRLPVKWIIQCRCVCKSWNSLITSPSFISTHLLRSKTLTPQNPQTFLSLYDMNDKYGVSLLHFDKENYFQSMLLHLPHIPSNPYIKTVGSVNGLICFSISQCGISRIVNYFIVCNPSIGRFKSVHPPAVRTWGLQCFGFDEKTQDYKILLIMADNAYFIYSLNLNSWKSITPPHTPDSFRNEPFNSVVFTNGRFHWLARRSYSDPVFIRVFDVKTETFGQISLPECLSIDSRLYCFTDFGESSFAVTEKTSTRRYGNGTHDHIIWVMKEYGSVESWIKLAAIRFDHYNGRVLGFRNEDEVFIRRDSIRDCGSTIALQKINRDEKVRKLMDVDDIPSLNFSVHRYVPSLVLLDKENSVDVAPPTHTIVDIASPTHTIVDIASPTRSRKRIRSKSQS